MADGTTLNLGSGGDTIATDDISSQKYPRGKLIHGVDGTNDGDSCLTNPFPVAAVQRTDKMSDGTTTLITPLFAVISASADATIVAAVPTKKIRVIAAQWVAAGTYTFRWTSNNAAGTGLTGVMTTVVGSPVTLPYNPVGWFETVAGEALFMDQTTTGQISGSLVYVTV